MPRISALPAATTISPDDEVPMVDVSDATTKKFTLSQLMPTGTVTDFAGATAPAGWLLCYGQTLNGSTNPEYAALYAIIGVTYGGTGLTSFKVPDCRGRVVAGQDDMGGSSANRLTGVTGSLDGDVMGAVGGEEAHTLTAAEDAVHALTMSHHGDEGGSVVRGFGGTNVSTSYISVPGVYRPPNGAVGGATSFQSPTGNWGSGSAHNNVQPTIILNKIIKY